MSCLLNLKRIKKKPNEGKTDYSNRRKKDFITMTSLSLNYKGIPVYFNLLYKGIDECYEKFTVGSERYHSTKKPDFRRVERLEWIYEIINKINNCEVCSEYRFGRSKGKDLTYCVEKQYLIVLKRMSNCYIVVTAYSVNNDKNQQEKYKNMTE